MGVVLNRTVTGMGVCRQEVCLELLHVRITHVQPPAMPWACLSHYLHHHENIWHPCSLEYYVGETCQILKQNKHLLGLIQINPVAAAIQA